MKTCTRKYKTLRDPKSVTGETNYNDKYAQSKQNTEMRKYNSIKATRLQPVALRLTRFAKRVQSHLKFLKI